MAEFIVNYYMKQLSNLTNWTERAAKSNTADIIFIKHNDEKYQYWLYVLHIILVIDFMKPHTVMNVNASNVKP